MENLSPALSVFSWKLKILSNCASQWKQIIWHIYLQRAVKHSHLMCQEVINICSKVLCLHVSPDLFFFFPSICHFTGQAFFKLSPRTLFQPHPQTFSSLLPPNPCLSCTQSQNSLPKPKGFLFNHYPKSPIISLLAHLLMCHDTDRLYVIQTTQKCHIVGITNREADILNQPYPL